MLVYLCIHVRLRVFDVCACVCEYMYNIDIITIFEIEKNPNKSMSSCVVINVEFTITEYNVSESEDSVMIQLVANETSEFDYSVTLMLTDSSTGE